MYIVYCILHNENKKKQEAHGPHCSPEKHFLTINKLERKIDFSSRLLKGWYYVPLKKGMRMKMVLPFIWTNLSPSPKNTLCQVWLKLAQWFWKSKMFTDRWQSRTLEGNQLSAKVSLNMQKVLENWCDHLFEQTWMSFTKGSFVKKLVKNWKTKKIAIIFYCWGSGKIKVIWLASKKTKWLHDLLLIRIQLG